MIVFLVGFMGCGKSTIGKKLAKKLEVKFIDSDNAIEKAAGKSIQEIFDQEGENEFRRMELDFLKTFKEENAVVALGGGTPCDEERLKIIQEKGEIIYVQMPPEALCKRLLEAKKVRPLVQEYKDSPKELLDYIENKLKERSPFYKQANITISGLNISSERLELISKLLSSNQENR